MTEQELLTALQTTLKDVYDDMTSTELDRAVAQALSETGWSFPVTREFQKYWIVERATRHALFIRCVSAALDFKYKKISLEQVWEHIWDMIKMMDKAFTEAMKSNPDEFPIEVTADAYKQFGSVIPAGFTYDQLGRDVTYLDGQDPFKIVPTDS